VLENVVYGIDGYVSLNDIDNACEVASVHEFIMTSHDGYDTLIGEHAVDFSEG